MSARFKLATVIIFSAMLGACTSLQPVSDWQSLHQGDKVRISTRTDDARVELKISAIAPERIEGWNVKDKVQTTIPADQVTGVEVRHRSVAKTTLLVVGLSAATLALLYGIAVASLVDNLSGPSVAAVAAP